MWHLSHMSWQGLKTSLKTQLRRHWELIRDEVSRFVKGQTPPTRKKPGEDRMLILSPKIKDSTGSPISAGLWTYVLYFQVRILKCHSREIGQKGHAWIRAPAPPKPFLPTNFILHWNLSRSAMGAVGCHKVCAKHLTMPGMNSSCFSLQNKRKHWAKAGVSAFSVSTTHSDVCIWESKAINTVPVSRRPLVGRAIKRSRKQCNSLLLYSTA